MIKNIRNPFRLKKENKKKKKRKAIKDITITDVRTLLELEKDYYKQVAAIRLVTIALNAKVIVIKIKLYQLRNTLKKLGSI